MGMMSAKKPQRHATPPRMGSALANQDYVHYGAPQQSHDSAVSYYQDMIMDPSKLQHMLHDHSAPGGGGVLPPYWCKCRDLEGRVYYQNDFNKTTQWEVPTEEIAHEEHGQEEYQHQVQGEGQCLYPPQPNDQENSHNNEQQEHHRHCDYQYDYPQKTEQQENSQQLEEQEHHRHCDYQYDYPQKPEQQENSQQLEEQENPQQTEDQYYNPLQPEEQHECLTQEYQQQEGCQRKKQENKYEDQHEEQECQHEQQECQHEQQECQHEQQECQHEQQVYQRQQENYKKQQQACQNQPQQAYQHQQQAYQHQQQEAYQHQQQQAYQHQQQQAYRYEQQSHERLSIEVEHQTNANAQKTHTLLHMDEHQNREDLHSDVLAFESNEKQQSPHARKDCDSLCRKFNNMLVNDRVFYFTQTRHVKELVSLQMHVTGGKYRKYVNDLMQDLENRHTEFAFTYAFTQHLQTHMIPMNDSINSLNVFDTFINTKSSLLQLDAAACAVLKFAIMNMKIQNMGYDKKKHYPVVDIDG